MWVESELRRFMVDWVYLIVALGTQHRVSCGCSTCVHARYELGWY